VKTVTWLYLKAPENKCCKIQQSAQYKRKKERRVGVGSRKEEKCSKVQGKQVALN
jgi:hypothetical protein